MLDIDLEIPSQSLAKIARRPEFKDAMALNMGGQRFLAVNTAALLNEICDESRFKKMVHLGLEKLRSVAGDGLFTAHNEEPNWGVAHRILMPVFGPMKIREMFPQMKDIASQMCLKWYVSDTLPNFPTQLYRQQLTDEKGSAWRGLRHRRRLGLHAAHTRYHRAVHNGLPVQQFLRQQHDASVRR